MTPHSTRIPSGLGRLGTAVVLILLLIGSTVLMHTLAGHTTSHAAAPTVAEHSHSAPHAERSAGTVHAAEAPLLVPAGASDDCGGLCAMLCAVMGMACLMVLLVTAAVLLRRRGTRALFILSKTLGALPALPTIVVPRLSMNLSQLSVLRV
ncbi:TPA: hypothetical protein IYE61_002699 [Enterococcus faecium]|nr:hypothetical protein [Enterococcus faecium]